MLLTFSLFLISLIIPTRTSTLMLYTQFQNHFPKFYNFPSGNPLLLFNPTPPQEHVSFPSPLPSQSQPNVTVLNKINTISIHLLKLIILTRGNIWRNIYSYCETLPLRLQYRNKRLNTFSASCTWCKMAQNHHSIAP